MRRFIEKGKLVDDEGRVDEMNSKAHRAAVIGSSVGVVLKKNAGCAIFSSIKLMGMLTVLFGVKFADLHDIS